MLKQFFSHNPQKAQAILAFVRVITGAMMIYHGWELFDKSIIDKYLEWEVFKKMPAPVFWVYTGKIGELVAGLLLALGFLTRIGALLLILVMCFITFVIGKGIIWYDDQHPFLFILLGLIFLFNGGGLYSLDKILFIKQGRFDNNSIT